ncbi:MAG TPA: DNA repair exonuclease [Armatimonadota bacterium]|nr:DNA repair exonuclease [Armatimonadota bacterium]
MARARFLHAADLHLSRPFGFLPPQLAEERRRDQRRALTKITDLALERDVDLVLIAGDLFDSPDPDPTDLEAATRELSRLADGGKRIFAIPGNHDFASPNSFWQGMNLEGLHIFLDTEWSSVALDDLGIAVMGIAFHHGKSERRAFEGLETPDEMPCVLLVHASWEAFEGQLERYHPFSAADLAGTKASYVALGHYHSFKPILGDGVAACYSGTPEGISFDKAETEDRFVIVGEIGEDGKAKIEPVKINNRIMRSAEIDCTSFESQMGLFAAVRRLCQPNALIELRLVGSPTADLATVLEELPDRFRESCLHLATDMSNLSLVADLPADDRTIRGRFCKRLLQQVESSSEPESRRLLRRALELGLAAFTEE